jgi:hypothetical protein
MDRQGRSAPLRLQLKGPVRDDPRGDRVVGAGPRAGFDASLAAETIAKDQRVERRSRRKVRLQPGAARPISIFARLRNNRASLALTFEAAWKLAALPVPRTRRESRQAAQEEALLDECGLLTGAQLSSRALRWAARY